MNSSPQPKTEVVRLAFEGGTLRVEGLGEADPLPCVYDPRSGCHRAPASRYAEVVLALRARGTPYVDEARAYEDLDLGDLKRQEPFYYQREALEAWERHSSRGVIVLPTGAGKTFVAVMAIDRRPRSTLVVVPTLDLLHQWYDLLQAAFARPVGIIGGGYYEPSAITVTTYDSAYLHAEKLGNRFGLVVFDECHHLPSESYALAARSLLAPFRLGLSATPERTDGGEARYAELIGPIVYRKDIDELSGTYLASYETQRIEISLTDEERDEYRAERALYLAFLRGQGIHMSSPSGWADFIAKSTRSEEGRRAFLAYRRQRQLALTATRKLETLERLLLSHRNDRVLVFTEDNATVYEIAERFLLPAITHQTRVKERSAILQAFNRGELTAVVTSKVLNEGVNVPEANVAVVLSGSGSVREHVQRLGRILRKREHKRAILYELVSAGTSEEGTSAKRREHRAYQ
ncbi:MAG: DEAD/DEAH box helicase family protein [Deltaproteobacteria bacterium]|nr:DEAD/DEAH box helicase family protein [Deltaproteobacteria bacterium]